MASHSATLVYTKWDWESLRTYVNVNEWCALLQLLMPLLLATVAQAGCCCWVGPIAIAGSCSGIISCSSAWSTPQHCVHRKAHHLVSTVQRHYLDGIWPLQSSTGVCIIAQTHLLIQHVQYYAETQCARVKTKKWSQYLHRSLLRCRLNGHIAWPKLLWS